MRVNNKSYKLKSHLWLIAGLLLTLLWQPAAAQDINSLNSETESQLTNNDNKQEEPKKKRRKRGRENSEESESDTTKKERKPLTSYFFDDSLKMRTIFAWNVNQQFNRIDTITVDTIMQNFEQDYPFFHGTDVGSPETSVSGLFVRTGIRCISVPSVKGKVFQCQKAVHSPLLFRIGTKGKGRRATARNPRSEHLAIFGL